MAQCPHMESCEMYSLFSHSGTLAVWKINYCTSEFTRCARYQRSLEGRLVPITLLPNGKELNVTTPKK